MIKFRDKGFYCCLCGKKMSDDEKTVEHIIPRSKGGSNHRHNLTFSCKKCNNSRGSKTHILPKFSTSDGLELEPAIRNLLMRKAQMKSSVLKSGMEIEE